MNRVIAFLAVAATLAALAGEPADGPVAAEEPPSTEGGADVAPLSAGDVLRLATSRFPVEPLSLSGSLILRRQAGVIVREVPFHIALDWGSDPATAVYTLFDGFGRVSCVLRASRSADGAVQTALSDASGHALPSPALTDPVAGTDITWLDITLSYLWWADGDLKGSETFKGALCDIVEMRPPRPIPGCAAVRLWIDRRRGFMRQAEQIDETGERVRWMWVSSVGRIRDRWMIRNLEVKRPGTGLQTKLHVDDLETP